MNKVINRENYEEFFLLYVDGELSATEKQAVELFVQEHTDLGFELDLLKQVQLSSEQIDFPTKSLLYHGEDTVAADAEMEEQLLLYIDHELDKPSEQQLAKLIATDAGYQSMHAQLSQTLLPIEKIVFPDKASLYKEEKVRVVYFQWWKMAAAASLIGFAFLLWTRLSNDSIPKQTLAKNASKEKSGSIVNKKNAPIVPVAPVLANQIANTVKQSTQTKNLPLSTGASINNNQAVSNQQSTILAENTGGVINTTTDANITTHQTTEDKTAESKQTEVARVNTDEISVKQVLPVTENVENRSIAHPAVYKELDTDDEKKSLYLGAIEINKDKLRGFFRKASSLFRSKAKQEDDGRTDSNTETATRALK